MMAPWLFKLEPQLPRLVPGHLYIQAPGPESVLNTGTAQVASEGGLEVVNW